MRPCETVKITGSPATLLGAVPVGAAAIVNEPLCVPPLLDTLKVPPLADVNTSESVWKRPTSYQWPGSFRVVPDVGVQVYVPKLSSAMPDNVSK